MTEAQTKIIKNIDNLNGAVKGLVKSSFYFHNALEKFRIQQRELRNLNIKSWTLGLTYLEKQRLK